VALRLNREATEILVGALALAAFAIFVVIAFTVNQKSVSGYPLRAVYGHIDGLSLHADVRLAGIRIGEVTSEEFDPAHDQAIVTLTIANGVELPRDSAAIVASDGLFGGKFIKIDPGGDTEAMKPGESFDYVQDSVDLERLLQRVVQQAEARRNAAAGQATPPAGKGG
jgi:phospholipid/cholesterol/gamma-HCH transport system substrate-binding protein